MKTQEFSSLGLKLMVPVPETVAEFDTLAKKQGACLEEAINNVAYRSVLAEARDLFIHGRDEEKDEAGKVKVHAFTGAETKFKFDRATKPSGRKNAKGEPILVFDWSEADYKAKLLAHLVKQGDTEEAAKTKLQAHMDAVSKVLRFDPSARERKPAAPRKLADKYLNTAKAILAGSNVKRFLADVKKALGKEYTLSGDNAKDAEPIGWLVKELAAWKEAQDLQKMIGG